MPAATNVVDLGLSQADRESTADFDPGNGLDYSLEGDLVSEPEVAEEDDGQLFVVEDAQRVTLGTLFRRGTPVDYEFKLTGKSIRGQGGLIGLGETNVLMLMRFAPGKVEVVPTRDPDGNVERVTVRTVLRPLAAYQAGSEAAEAALSGE